MNECHSSIPNRNKFWNKFEEAIIMNAYLASVLENVRTKHGNEPEFV